MTSHSQATAVHRPYAWEYADATARGAATGFVATDVGKLARQLDTNALWMLTDDSPVTWVQVGSSSSSGYAEGTSFPGSPSTNDKYYRTDRNLLYYYDGTRWLTTQVFLIELKMEENVVWGNSGSTLPVHRGAPVFGDDYDLYLLDWHFLSSVVTTNNGTNFWTAKLWKFNAAGGGDTQVGASVSTGTTPDTAGSVYNKKVAINALLGAYKGFYTESVKTLSPGVFRFHGGHITCRAVG